MSNNTIPIEDDDDELVVEGASLTVVMFVVGGISIVAIVIIAIICFRRWKRRKSKKFKIISPDINNSEEEDRLQDMPMNQFVISDETTLTAIEDDEEKSEL